MEHSALIESMVWRARQSTEIAYIKPNNFLSLMFDVFDRVSDWFVDFLSGPYISGNMWLALNCDNNKNNKDSIKNNVVIHKKTSINFNCDVKYKRNADFNLNNNNVDFPHVIFAKLFKTANELEKLCTVNRNFTAEKFMKDLCELVETIDVKHTNL